MKNKHIGELKIFHEKSLFNYKEDVNDLILDRVYELTLYFKNYSIDIHEVDVELMNNGDIKIDCCFYNDLLLDAYKNKNKIFLIEEKGCLVNPKDHSKMLNYIRTYKKYKMKSVSGGSEYNKHWVYTLKPCLF